MYQICYQSSENKTLIDATRTDLSKEELKSTVTEKAAANIVLIGAELPKI